MNEWQPIGTAPTDRRVMLIDDLDNWPYFGRWNPDYGDRGMWMEDDMAVPDYQPTHWMPPPSLKHPSE